VVAVKKIYEMTHVRRIVEVAPIINEDNANPNAQNRNGVWPNRIVVE
jgi:hypothetical protein